MGSKKANLVHKNAGESVLMNIQTNLNNMHAETQESVHRDKTNLFMDKLRRRFLGD